MKIKGIVQNMIEMEAVRFAEKRSGKFFEVVEGSFHFTDGTKDREPIYDITIRQICGWHDYRLSGYVSDYGDVSVCSVSYSRTYRDADGSNERNELKFLHGAEMNLFKFDK